MTIRIAVAAAIALLATSGSAFAERSFCDQAAAEERIYCMEMGPTRETNDSWGCFKAKAKLLLC